MPDLHNEEDAIWGRASKVHCADIEADLHLNNSDEDNQRKGESMADEVVHVGVEGWR